MRRKAARIETGAWQMRRHARDVKSPRIETGAWQARLTAIRALSFRSLFLYWCLGHTICNAIHTAGNGPLPTTKLPVVRGWNLGSWCCAPRLMQRRGTLAFVFNFVRENIFFSRQLFLLFFIQPVTPVACSRSVALCFCLALTVLAAMRRQAYI